MQKYPNLPGVEQFLIDGGQMVSINTSLPASLIFGWTSQDSFSDGTPIMFNEPYPIPASSALETMFTTSSDLLGAAYDFYVGSTGTGGTPAAVPVLVRTGFQVNKFDPTGTLMDSDDVKIKTANIPTCVVEELTTDSGFQGKFNGTVRIIFIDAPDAAASFDGGVIAVSFDEGASYEAGFESVDITGASYELTVPSTGLKFTLAVAAETPVAVADGDYFEVTVTYANEPDTADKRYKALSDAFKALEGYDASYIVIAGVYADDTLTANVLDYLEEDDPDYEAGSHTDLSVPYQVARFAYDNSSLSTQCIAFMGVNEPTDYGFLAMSTWADTLASSLPDMYKTADGLVTGEAMTDTEGSLIDMGKNLCVIVGHGTVLGKSGRRNLASYVGGFMISQPLGSGAARTVLPKAQLTYDINMNQANTIAGGRMTPVFIQRTTSGLQTYLVTGRTAADAESSFTKVSTVRVINYVVNRLRNIGERYVGKPNSPIYVEAMKTEMESSIQAGAELGLYDSGTLSVIPTSGNTIGSLDVYANIRAYTEIQNVRIFARFEYIQ